MPLVGPSPITPTTPSVPGFNLSGGGSTFPAAGVNAPCSAVFGVSSDYECSGPWMIETQRMDIQYVRVPVYDASSETLNLTNPTVSYRVAYTYLQSIVTAQYKVEKSYAYYDTSTFTQPQTFEWFPASSDSYGNTYGAVGASALGPAGNIQTKQQWYNRRPWVSGVDAEINKNMNGMRTFERQKEFGNAAPQRYRGGLEGFGDFKTVRWSLYANTFLDHRDFFIFGDKDYLLPSQYITTLENTINIVNYINGLGLACTNVQYYQPDAAERDNTFIPRDRGFSEYSVNRHGWV